MYFTLIFQGKSYTLQHLDVSAALDGGVPRAVAVTYEPLPNLKRGDVVTIEADDWKLPLSVRSFRHTAITLSDLAHAAPHFAGFAVADATWHDVLHQRIRLTGADLKSPKHPAVLLDDVSLPQVLGHLAAERGWHWYPTDQDIHLGPLENGPATELAIDSHLSTDEGDEVHVRQGVPRLGSLVKAGGTEGRVLSWHVLYRSGQAANISAVIGVPRPRTPARLVAVAWVPATVQAVDPLVAEVVLHGRTMKLRVQLLDLQSQAGKTRISLPAAMGDHVRVIWPKGVFAGLPEALPLGPSAGAKSLQVVSAEAAFRINQWNVVADRIDHTIADVVDYHR